MPQKNPKTVQAASVCTDMPQVPAFTVKLVDGHSFINQIEEGVRLIVVARVVEEVARLWILIEDIVGR